MTDPQQPPASDRTDTGDVEQHACPKCDAQPGSPCRSRGGAVASACRTRRFAMAPRPKKALRVPTGVRGRRSRRRRRPGARPRRRSSSARPAQRTGPRRRIWNAWRWT
ncbi:zinc finger domain-containing protein [Streptomyces celluloflavus]